MIDMDRNDRTSLVKLRAPRVTANGTVIASARASRIGIQVYQRADGSPLRELRPADEVFKAESLAAFEGLVLTDDHPDVSITAHNAREHAVGTVLGPGKRDGDHVVVRLALHDADAIAKLRAGKIELSVGYAVDLDETPGKHDEFGEYDAIQRNIRPNHLALVERGRCGPSCRIATDCACKTSGPAPAKETPVATKKRDRLVAAIKHLDPGSLVADRATPSELADRLIELLGERDDLYDGVRWDAKPVAYRVGFALAAAEKSSRHAVRMGRASASSTASKADASTRPIEVPAHWAARSGRSRADKSRQLEVDAAASLRRHGGRPRTEHELLAGAIVDALDARDARKGDA